MFPPLLMSTSAQKIGHPSVLVNCSIWQRVKLEIPTLFFLSIWNQMLKCALDAYTPIIPLDATISHVHTALSFVIARFVSGEQMERFNPVPLCKTLIMLILLAFKRTIQVFKKACLLFQQIWNPYLNRNTKYIYVNILTLQLCFCLRTVGESTQLKNC